MKIALITIHRTANYGAVLQAYATKLVLSRYGEVSTIDYDNRHLAHHLDLIRFDVSLRGIMMLAHDILRFPYRINAVSKFRKFIRENMNLTLKLTSKELLEGKAGDFDAYVCGSDQIWNPEIVSSDTKIDPIYFLSFAPKCRKKISYASSIGHHHYSDDEKQEVRKLLDDFEMISTRENDGVKKLAEVFPGREIHHVLDPTLILSKEEWLEAFNFKSQKQKEKYILVYSVPRTELIIKAVDFFAKKLGFKVVAIDPMLFPLTNVDKHIRTAGPKEFIELYANAEFVITDSFHGTCFAVNLGKPFVAVSPGSRANRIISLLTLLGINERLVTTESEFESISLILDIESVSTKLGHARNKSKNILAGYISKS
ncbi:polysaccharide pyruvyl transferase family protein [Trichlorobacter lovleyi]|uniref:polysaccharide pyruvyl transferase family protein n=1 Tax=Trichlorobacter lovleyi TaxID=313985 RepID=UPI00223FBC4C|nr:polysaccharide pyruvyl transferase family protein [Trichlorobacter lovleyi]QOX78541.1 polysaccharide pyruvyl transferase family protein [Trichlorobacter lovleyi]